jgi:hypothetical protein
MAKNGLSHRPKVQTLIAVQTPCRGDTCSSDRCYDATRAISRFDFAIRRQARLVSKAGAARKPRQPLRSDS